MSEIVNKLEDALSSAAISSDSSNSNSSSSSNSNNNNSNNNEGKSKKAAKGPKAAKPVPTPVAAPDHDSVFETAVAGLKDLSLCDIGANMLDEMFTGVYNEKEYHEADLELVLERALKAGVKHIIITAGSVEESKQAIALTRRLRASESYSNFPHLTCTVGIHPTRCSVFNCDEASRTAIVSELENLIRDGVADQCVVAVGECGLDYDRLHFCEKVHQKIGFQAQIDMAEKFELPLFLHDRNTESDMDNILKANLSKIRGSGVVHSFTGPLELMRSFVDLGFYIGINGCSLKTDENVDVARQIPLERLLIETDAPWCAIKPTHASYSSVTSHFPSKDRKKYERGALVKDRCEPCMLGQVLQVLAAARGSDVPSLADAIRINTERLFKIALRK